MIRMHQNKINERNKKVMKDLQTCTCIPLGLRVTQQLEWREDR